MNEPERELTAMKPASPSEDFERRMAVLFEETRPRQAFWRRDIAAWQAAAACLLCAFAGFGASRFLQSTTTVPEPEVRTEFYMMPADNTATWSAFDFTGTPPYRSAASLPVEIVVQATDGSQNT